MQLKKLRRREGLACARSGRWEAAARSRRRLCLGGSLTGSLGVLGLAVRAALPRAPGALGRAPPDSRMNPRAPLGAAPPLAPLARPVAVELARTPFLAPAGLPQWQAPPEEASRPTALLAAQGKAFAETLASRSPEPGHPGSWSYSWAAGGGGAPWESPLPPRARRMMEAPGWSLTSWTTGICWGGVCWEHRPLHTAQSSDGSAAASYLWDLGKVTACKVWIKIGSPYTVSHSLRWRL